MHAIGQHERLSLANGLLLVQMFSQADKLRTVSRGMPGVKKKKKGYSKFESQNWKSNANPPNEYSNNRIFWSSPTAFILYIFVSVSPFEWRIYTIDSCWNIQLIPLTNVQNAYVSLPSAVVCAVCSSAVFWSDARWQHRRLSSLLVLWSRLCVSRPLAYCRYRGSHQQHSLTLCTFLYLVILKKFQFSLFFLLWRLAIAVGQDGE